MEKERGAQRFFKEGALWTLGGGVVAEVAGLPVIVWASLLKAGAVLGLGWAGMKFFNRSKSPQPTH